tara:strand:- start:426 stop:767 length:342 start_codon:yes stop_codon:yes gene_type:complete
LIRQDKITFLISKLENIDLYKAINYDTHVHHDTFETPDYIERFFKRVGVIAKNENNISKILTEYLPVNKHDFLKKALLKFTEDYCFENNPRCIECCLDISCDYYNKKNDWSIV